MFHFVLDLYTTSTFALAMQRIATSVVVWGQLEVCLIVLGRLNPINTNLTDVRRHKKITSA
jgi:hypothetical protein